VYLHATVNSGIFCLEKVLTGDYTYHFTYHVDKKSGNITSIHWNIIDCNLVDSEGNKYRIVDSGFDNLGGVWDLFNNLNAYNEAIDCDIVYDPDDGFMDLPDAGDWPEEGMTQWVFRIIGDGEVYKYTSFLKGYYNEDGELVLTVVKEKIDCNW
jgi:hypothetical protein